MASTQDVTKLEASAVRAQERADKARESLDAAQQQELAERQRRLEEFDDQLLADHDPSAMEEEEKQARQRLRAEVAKTPWGKAYIVARRLYHLRHLLAMEIHEIKQRKAGPRRIVQPSTPPFRPPELLEMTQGVLEDEAREQAQQELEALRAQRLRYAEGESD